MQTNATISANTTPVKPYKDVAFEEYVSFCAIGSLITSDDGSLSKMTTMQFCQQFGVDRATTWRWRQTQDFGDKVRARREELFPMARESACWNQLYLIGMQSHDLKAAVQAITLLLGHFSGLKLPARRQPETEQKQTSWVELVMKAREQETNLDSQNAR